MVQDNRFFDDAARLASGAMGTLVGLKREVESMVRAQVERLLDGMDLVRRDEFEAVREMAANARAEQERLTERIAALEAASARPKAARPRARKPAPPEADIPSE